MNRPTAYLLGAFAAALVAAAPTLCATIFSDNFTDQAASLIENWALNPLEGGMKGTVKDGSFTVDNSANKYVGEYVHTLSAKPATFTLSYTLKSVQGNLAGVLFCKQSGSGLAGYILTAEDNSLGKVIAVRKVVTAGTITAEPIFYQNSVDLNPSNNLLTVSKSGSSFHVYANGVFQGSFTDASYNSGDISLLLFNQTKAVFGELRVTDEFKPGSGRTSFSDDFNDGAINKYWRQDITSASGPKPTVGEANGKLNITTADGGGAYIYVDINLTAFDASVEATHISGDLGKGRYGFFLVGENTQMAKFFIVGGGYYAVLKPGETDYKLLQNSKIRGGKGHSLTPPVNLTDTLILRKKDNSNYEFLANGESLTININSVGFNIKGIGLFCENDVSVAFDNFNVEQDKNSTAIRQNDKKQVSRAAPTTTRGHAFYDMRGRIRYTATPTAGRAQTKAAGIYINKNGRDVTVRKGKVVSE